MRSKLALLGISFLFLTSACGEPTRPSQSLPTPTLSESPSPSPSPTASPTAWETYSNSEFGFAIDYPSDFRASVSKGNSSDRAGQLLNGIFLDKMTPSGQLAPGAVGLGVYAKDADSTEGWVAKHSAEGSPEDPEIYYYDVSNQRSLIVEGHPAIAFDWQAAEIGAVHVVAFFFDKGVFELEWFADDKTYAPTIEPIFERMLDSYRE
jgi:hypothetical protein